MASEFAFPAFQAELRRTWRSGQHLSILGATGAGKTYLAADILSPRKYVCLVSTKLEDKTLKRYGDYSVIKSWDERHVLQHRYILWPKPKSLRETGKVRETVYEMMESVFRSGGWTIVFDDLVLLTREMHLRSELAAMYVFVRSHGTSLVGLYQRPVYVPREATTQSSHWLLVGALDEEDLRILAASAAVPYKELRELNRSLSGHNFIWLARGQEPVFVRREKS